MITSLLFLLSCEAAAIEYYPITGGGGTTVYKGIPFEFASNELVVTHYPPDLGIQTYEFPSPQIFYAERVHFMSSLAWSHWVTQGTVVGEIRGYYSDGSYDSGALIAGVNTAEWAWDRPGWEGLILHDKAEVSYSWPTTVDSDTEYEGHRYYGSFATDPSKELHYVQLRMSDDLYNDPCHWLAIGVPAITIEGRPIPEASTLALFGLGSLSLLFWRRRRGR